MEIAIIEVRYPYKMSYLDEWLKAWTLVSKKVRVFNVLKNSEVNDLKKSVSKFDLIVILHSVTADSNKWLRDMVPVLTKRKCQIILFVGNEYSNPWLSMESRLQNIADIQPEVVATQLSQEAGEFLYESSGGVIVETPHALPRRELGENFNSIRNIDLGFRGFEYPWFILDSDRNSVVKDVSDFYKLQNLNVDTSNHERLNKEKWYNFLTSCKTTVASEGGSNFVFKTDKVWTEALRFLESSNAGKFLGNDFAGASLLRVLPGNLKKILRDVGKMLGQQQGATSELSSEILSGVLSKIHVDDFKYVSGKALTSRHMDAIYCGAWQILTPGQYNGILQPGSHFTLWNSISPEEAFREVEEAIALKRNLSIYEELIGENSYQSRIQNLLARL